MIVQEILYGKYLKKNLQTFNCFRNPCHRLFKKRFISQRNQWNTQGYKIVPL